ncbi:hypothetical protein JCM11641_001239 [Rhodosporidiobolus odoratus]
MASPPSPCCPRPSSPPSPNPILHCDASIPSHLAPDAPVKFSTAAAAASAVAFAGFASAQKIDTPTALYTCQPYQLAWSGGTAPYYVRVLVGGTTSDVLETLLTSTTETSYTWNVDQPAGTSITLGLTDSTGATAYSAAVRHDVVSVSDGGDTSCVGAAASGSSAASSAAGSATLAASSASSGASSSAASKASSAGGSATSAASSAAASATGDSSAGSLAVSGVLGVAALGAALFA